MSTQTLAIEQAQSQQGRMVKIANPLPGGACWTSRNRAKRYVKKGRARFVSAGVVEFIEAHSTDDQCRKLDEMSLHRRMTGAEYDRTPGTFDKQLRRVPMVEPDKFIREERSSRDWSYHAGSYRSIFLPHTAELVKQIRERQGGERDRVSIRVVGRR